MNLESVLEKVKEVMKENEELGEIIMELGKEERGEWEKALEGLSFSFVSLSL